MFNIKNHILTISFCMIFCLLACSSKQGPINDLEVLTEDVQVNGSNYSEEDWSAVAEELDVIDSEMEQHKGEYTDDELKEIGRLKGILLAQYTKYSVKAIKNGVENAMKEAEGLIDGFMNSFSNESSK